MRLAYKHLDLIIVAMVAVLILSNIASSAKIVVLGPFVFDAGTLLFPLSYIFGDVLTEVYGYKQARRAIWLGFGAIALMAVVVIIVGALPGEAEWERSVGQDAYNKIFSLTPRLVIASLLAYWAGSFANASVLARLKALTQHRHLWLRTIASTLVGELIDTVIVILVAFYGVLPDDVLWQILISNYVFKVAVEVLFTPLTYAVVNWLKNSEGLEPALDADLNPFSLSASVRDSAKALDQPSAIKAAPTTPASSPSMASTILTLSRLFLLMAYCSAISRICETIHSPRPSITPPP